MLSCLVIIEKINENNIFLSKKTSVIEERSNFSNIFNEQQT